MHSLLFLLWCSAACLSWIGMLTVSTLLCPFQGSKGDPGVAGPMGPAGLPVSMGVLGISLQSLFPAVVDSWRCCCNTVFAVTAGLGLTQVTGVCSLWEWQKKLSSFRADSEWYGGGWRETLNSPWFLKYQKKAVWDSQDVSLRPKCCFRAAPFTFHSLGAFLPPVWGSPVLSLQGQKLPSVRSVPLSGIAFCKMGPVLVLWPNAVMELLCCVTQKRKFAALS